MKLKSLTQRIKSVESESGSLRMFREGLVFSFMRLGVSFIAPRQLGAVGGQLEGQICLLSGGAPDRTVTVVVRCAISFLFGASDRWSSRSVGAPDTVWCTQDSPVCPTDRCCGPRVARRSRGRPLALATVGSPDSLMHHRTVQ
jgi:hypothetical protein